MRVWRRWLLLLLVVTGGVILGVCRADTPDPESSSTRTTLPPRDEGQSNPAELAKMSPEGVGRLLIGANLTETEQLFGPTELAGGDGAIGYSCEIRGFRREDLADVSALVDTRSETIVILFVEFGSHRLSTFGPGIGASQETVVEAVEKLDYEASKVAFDPSQTVIKVRGSDNYALAFYLQDGEVVRMAAGVEDWLELEPHVQVENCRPE